MNMANSPAMNAMREQAMANNMAGMQQGAPVLSAVPMANVMARDSPPTSMADELKKLAEMKQQGLLTDEEFGAAKAKLLSV